MSDFSAASTTEDMSSYGMTRAAPPIADGTSTPQSIEELEQLVKRLYSSGNPVLITSIERHLQWHQRSELGWEMANSLLGSEDVNVRFFGALTYVVKLNSPLEGIDDSKERIMVSWFLRLANDQQRVQHKFTQAMALLFLHPVGSATDCLPRLAASMAAGLPLLDVDVQKMADGIPPLANTLPLLQTHQLLFLTNFCGDMIDEACKKNMSDKVVLFVSLRKRIQNMSGHAIELMQFALRDKDGAGVQSSGAKLFLTWTIRYDKCWTMDSQERDAMLVLFRPTLQLLVQAKDDFGTQADDILDLIAELLDNNPTILKTEHLDDLSQFLRSPYGKEHMRHIASMSEPSNAFARVLMAYGQADMSRLVSNTDSAAIVEIFEMLHALVKIEGYAAVEDEIILDALVYWVEFVEFCIEAKSTDRDPLHVSHIKGHVMRLLEELWAKIRFPSAATWDNWEDDDKKAFTSFRNEVRDLLQSAHGYLGLDLLKAFVQITLTSLAQRDLLQVEAGLFSLNSIALALDETEEEDRVVALLFNSPLYEQLTNNDQSIPVRLRKTALRTLGQFGEYFERNQLGLSSALNFLFTHLGFESMSDEAARSIEKLCVACRKTLTGELDLFFQQYERFINSDVVEFFTKEKVITAVAAIAQALPTDQAKNAALNRLLDFVEDDIKLALECLSTGHTEESRLAATSGTLCLAGVGKGFQDPTDIIDLVDDSPITSYWSVGEGAVTQQRIIRLLTNCNILGDNGDVVENVCDVLRAGYTENSPGPFVLPAQVTVQILTPATLNTPNLAVILTTTCSFLSSHTHSITKSIIPIDNEVNALVFWLATLARTLKHPRNDPEIANSLIDTLQRFMPRHNAILFNLQPSDLLVDALNFVIATVRVPEALPKRSACSFWDVFLKQTNHSAALQGLLDQVAAHFGQLLVVALVCEAGGNCAKSDIEFLAPPLKKLLTRTPQAKSWIEDSLFLKPGALEMETSRAQAMGLGYVFRMRHADRAGFLRGLGVARDSASVRKVVVEFWEAARFAGSNPGNAWARRLGTR